MKSLILIIIYFTLLAGCISEFNPAIRNDNEYIIIDAKISDEEGASVKLFRLSGGETITKQLDINAEVIITDDMGGKIILSKLNPGIYFSNHNGVPGRRYTLNIKTADGLEYISTEEKMYPKVPIDSAYGLFEFHLSANLKNYTPGVQIYVDFNNSAQESKFFRWTYSETWIEKTPIRWLAYGTWDKRGNLLDINFWPDNSEHNRKCFHFRSSNEIVVKGTNRLKPVLLKANPLFFSDDLSKRFSVGYSVEIKQYAITPAAFLYFDQMQKNSELTGSLYDPVPTFIESNIYNRDNPEQKLTGFFVVSSVSKKRIFIKPSDIIPGNYLSSGAFVCQDSTVNSFSNVSKIHWESFNLDIYDYYPETPDTPMMIKIANTLCFDCTTNGGTIDKPSYWDDRFSGVDTLVKSK